LQLYAQLPVIYCFLLTIIESIIEYNELALFGVIVGIIGGIMVSFLLNLAPRIVARFVKRLLETPDNVNVIVQY
jgi:uncharacterized membrane protein YgaE (UPF0421/DUF939 family)